MLSCGMRFVQHQTLEHTASGDGDRELFGSAARVVDPDVSRFAARYREPAMSHDKTNVGAGCPEDVENIMGAALFALGRGAKRAWVTLPAIEAFRRQFTEKIGAAIQDADWRSNWREEQAYLLALVEAVGLRAARSAAEDGRTFITTQDLDLAMLKVQGHLPIARRWCPL
jgi:histone H3/H4